VAATVSETQGQKWFRGLAAVTELREVELGRDPLSTDELIALARQALDLVAGLYVHLPMKRAMYGVDPEQRLRLLLSRLRAETGGTGASLAERHVTELQFHNEMLDIFASLRDLHTTYILPSPYRDRIAFLPFMVEECVGDRGETHFAITKTHESVQHPTFRRGAMVRYWNGTPIGLAVELNGRRTGGSNPAARRARGTDWLTFRWLGRIARPDEDWVRIHYWYGGAQHVEEFPWWTAERPEDFGESTGLARDGLLRGVDQEGEWIRQVKRYLFGDAGTTPDTMKTTMPEVFRARKLADPEDEEPFGYLRIFTFAADRAQIVTEAARLLRRLPKRGLVLDVRGNGGGDIGAAEDVLQLLTKTPIAREPFAFLNTPLALDALSSRAFPRDADEDLAAIRTSVEVGIQTGSQYSRPFPLAGPDTAGAPLRRAYPGPVVLLVDALSYSATDVFAAGFQDNGIGVKVIGTSGRTGAGGANVWDSEDVDRVLSANGDLRFHPAAHRGGFTVAARRCTRVGRDAGMPLEDLGVEPDDVVRLTIEDVLGNNGDLIARAIDALKPAA